MENKTWREQYMMDQIDRVLKLVQKQMDNSKEVWEEDVDNEANLMHYVDWCARYGMLAFLKEDFKRLWDES